MKISIITVCYNSADTIRDTINSIANQTYKDVEHIVIDGGSNDQTMAIVRSSPSIAKYISEKDAGIYDAMNKGIKLATGEVVGILNADDFYADSEVLSKVVTQFQNASIQGCYGNLVYVEQKNTDKIVRYWKSRPYQQGLFKAGWMPAHPTFFTRKCIYDQYGSFNLDYRIAADFEILFRLIEQHKINVTYIPILMVKMRMGGTTNKSVKNILLQNQEVIQILQSVYGPISLVKFFVNKLINRFFQFFSRPI